MSLDRITRDEMLMEVASVIAKRGTCSRLKVGAVLSRDGRIISTGYNGAPKGTPHCIHDPSKYDTEGSCNIAEHAERNAVAYAARFGVTLDRADLHVTHAPCLACARTLVTAGIARVHYLVPYRLTDGVDFLASAGIDVFNLGTKDDMIVLW